MKIKRLLMVLMIVMLGLNLMAIRSVTFLKDGNSISDTIIDMSSRTGYVEFRDNPKVHRSRVWMINFENSQWDFAGERDRLSGNTDTIFLRNGHILNVKIVDFSSRRQMFEFFQGGAVHESKVARIYFCCDKLPAAYQKMKPTPSPDEGKRYSTSFIVDGRIVEYPLSYLNSQKTGFTDGLQINTKDLWMINFIDDNWDFPGERQRLSNRMDTVFMNDGKIIYDNVMDFDKSSLTFRFGRTGSVHESEIKRIYFCCTKLPTTFTKRPIRKRKW
ncbi:MAG: hypothetical protein GTO45_37615 [Candidatus Aminicenantes bacterium]|nr:hypothetical protein [Candidatus Aminicenantes bacterium]NIM84384.1 hypothetical protein [Candidatus Aminicenantes bacterium]NIN23871.1 hypothetical protein [Candidatus Aminicenantes bacterium]NIN47587.1 hypothetical protein [Candidatus Aminicenantes bacterium]NIN90507.1 hypothetical protein [Candidatus Aminicenantes bacterium]